MFSKLFGTQQEELKEWKTIKANFVVYLLPDNKEESFVTAHQLAAEQTPKCNAVLIYPDDNNASANNTGARKYKARFIQNGKFLSVAGQLKEVSIGARNFENAKLMTPNSIKNHENIIKTAFARAGLVLPTLLKHTEIARDLLPSSQVLDVKSFASLAQTSFVANQTLQPKQQKAILFNFLTHVIRGEQAQADRMLKKLLKSHLQLFPWLFEQKMMVTDYSGRRIEGTAFQLALGAEDVGIQENEECMAEMLARYIRMDENGEAILARQYQEQFPEGWEAQAAAESKEDFNALYNILVTPMSRPAPKKFLGCFCPF
jgi:hypothetical protein